MIHVIYGQAHRGDNVCQFFDSESDFSLGEFVKELPGVYSVAIVSGVDYEKFDLLHVADVQFPHSDRRQYYAWRERMPNGTLVVPHDDPMVYEFTYDIVFDTIEQAEDFRNECEEEGSEEWVLIQVTETVV